LGDPVPMRLSHADDFGLQARGEHLGRCAGGNGGQSRRPPSKVRSRPRVVICEFRNDDRSSRAHELPQRREDHASLERRIARRAKRTSELEWHPQGPRRFGVLGLRPDQADRDRRDPFFLEIMTERAHGARADRSNRRKDDGVDVVLFKPPGELAGVRLHFQRIGCAHKRVMGPRHRGDLAVCRQLV